MNWLTDWLHNFHWTAPQIALLGGLGVVTSGVLSFVGARRGSRDIRANQDKLIEAQSTAQAALLQAQREQAAIQRRQGLFDKQAESYEKVMLVAHSKSQLPDLPVDRATMNEYLKDLPEWDSRLKASLASLATYASVEI